ncbi:Lrp/AsnC family transcriptional regulator [Ahrensia marina]|uniref:Lrp/AsnC family transcriptional regulator n=1 Tax=Ahrensia marina TaxID=1514904 RepID=UPI0035D10365
MNDSDRRILAALQRDARLTNNDLAETVGLSPSQCSRRRAQLEEEGLITGYHAKLDREKTGFGLTSIISVTLATHSEDNSKRIRDLFAALPEVMEAHAMTGDMDYYVKIVTKDLKSLSEFINDKLLAHPAVQQVRTAVSLQTLKETNSLPV